MVTKNVKYHFDCVIAHDVKACAIFKKFVSCFGDDIFRNVRKAT